MVLDSQVDVVRASQLSKTIRGPAGDLEILKKLAFKVTSAQAVAILGASGSGKSTLLGLLAGLDTPTSGEVYLLGQPLSMLSEDQRAQLRAGAVGFVFQSFQLLPALTALENVMLSLELCGQAKGARQGAAEALAQVGLMPRIHHYPHQLSGGEQQRVAIARAFVAQPQILFADEPTGNLDQATGEQIIDLLFDLRERYGTALVLVTHDAELAQRCERRYVLKECVLTQSYPPLDSTQV
ncbi:ABC transporter ATP-binding protein [Thiorhodospira sibirica]|uniref:ABC transporter ATP-binding protein n=1 Tax=Thiorhodospira sibirica TaxID=154347 RepID=UPI00022C0BA3|nr:ATP-binding cassette domain-containing protein [Thiorhodospira sibirica]